MIFNSVKGSPTKVGTLYEDTAVYDCLPGFQTSSDDTITCQADKSWTAAPACVSRLMFVLSLILFKCLLNTPR